MISPAMAEDAAEIASLWNVYVGEGTASFRATPYASEEITALIEAQREAGQPFFVARIEKLLGFGLYRQFRGGDGYRKTMEHSIYLDPSAQGRGIGAKLLHALEEEARRAGVRSLIGGITSDNERSIAFHVKHGFHIVARIPEAGYKYDRYHDLTFLQKFLIEGGGGRG